MLRPLWMFSGGRFQWKGQENAASGFQADTSVSVIYVLGDVVRPFTGGTLGRTPVDRQGGMPELPEICPEPHELAGITPEICRVCEASRRKMVGYVRASLAIELTPCFSG